MTSDNKFLIFQLGTNNWQSANPEEFAPGSGILHASLHETFKTLPEVAGSFSIFPSQIQKNPIDRDDFRVFRLSHQIPICESVSPVSNYRWHSMTPAEFDAYRDRLVDEVQSYINETEERLGMYFNLFIAHHCFLNPVVMSIINENRVKAGKPKATLVVFSHGTANKMMLNELAGGKEYPSRFYPYMREQVKIFESNEKVSGVLAISKEQVEVFKKLYPNFPANNVVIAPNGYNQDIFKKVENATPSSVLSKFRPIYSEAVPPSKQLSKIPTADFDAFVICTGKYADWKRIDVVIRASKIYSENKKKRFCTLLVGTGPDSEFQKLQTLAYTELGMEKSVFFLGPQPQQVLAELNTIADIGVYPSKNEPFGLVIVESWGCKNPTIGAASGGPLDFVTDEVGALIQESDDHQVLAERLAKKVVEAIEENWKEKKGPRCAEYAVKNFSLKAQCSTILQAVEKWKSSTTTTTTTSSSSNLTTYVGIAAIVSAAIAVGVFFWKKKSKI